METNSMFTLMDILIAGSGLYVIYQYIVMVTKKELQENMILPKDLEIKKCRDQEAFIHYMGVKQLIFGIVTTICGVLGLIQDYTGKLGVSVYMAAVCVFIAVIVWFTVCLKKAIKLYW